MANAGVKSKLQTRTYEQKYKMITFVEANPEMKPKQLQQNLILGTKLSILKNLILSNLHLRWKVGWNSMGHLNQT